MSTIDPQKLHSESIVIDGLNASWFPSESVIERIHDGGITAVNATIAAWHNPAETLEMIGMVLEAIERCGSIATVIKSAEDIRRAKREGKTGFILGYQDTAPLGDNLKLLRVYRELGVGIIQLTYNFENSVGFGCQAPEDGGLKGFGRELVAEMNSQGILIDLSHCGPRTTLEAIEESVGPVAITHSNSAAFFPHPRNKSDETIKACVAKGGIIGAVAFPPMVTAEIPVTVEHYIDAIAYLVDLVGPDHVATGPDFMEEMPIEVIQTVLQGLSPEAIAQMQKMPSMDGFSTVSETPNVTTTLLKRGFSDDETAGIIGGNWLRLYEKVWVV